MSSKTSLLIRLFMSLFIVVGTLGPGAFAQSPVAVPNIDLTGIQVNALSGPPDIQITQVTNRGVIGDDATLVIRVAWTATVPTLTTLVEFTPSVKVTYADGSTNTATSQGLPGSARQADLRVLNKGTNSPRTFTASLAYQFNSVSLTPLPFTEEFDLTSPNGFTATDASQNRPSGALVNINQVKRDNQVCTPGKDCFTIRWSAAQRPGITINSFVVEAELTYRFPRSGTSTPPPPPVTRTGSISASASDRQKVIAVSPPDGFQPGSTGFSSIHAKITVKAAITTHQLLGTQKTGSF